MMLCGFQKSPGFSLTELIVALTLVGVIASFSIPKILYAMEDRDKRAILKETIGTLEEVMQKGRFQDRGLYPDTEISYFFNNIDALVKENCEAGPCWSNGRPASSGYYGQAYNWWTSGNVGESGFLLLNGAYVLGFRTSGQASTFSQDLLIDWNGNKQPNRVGRDQLWVTICYHSTQCSASHPGGVTIARPDAPWQTENSILFDDLYYVQPFYYEVETPED